MPIDSPTLGPKGLGSTSELASILNNLQREDNTFSIPSEANFIVKIDNIPYLAINNVIQDYYDENAQWEDIRGLRGELIKFIEEDKKINGRIVFATGVTIPGETLASGRVGPSTNTNVHGNLLSAPVIKGRNDPNNLTISFIETNISFTDYILRPWLFAVSTFGLFGRQTENQRVKGNLEVWHIDGFSKNSNSTRKQITYIDCAPVSVPDFTYAYGENGNVRVVNTNWTYKSYKITNIDGDRS
jgi:hypothetical protein